MNNYEVCRLIDRVEYKNGFIRIDCVLRFVNIYFFIFVGGLCRNVLKVGIYIFRI